MALDRKLRYGMVGGGPGAFIGEVHRSAAALDGGIELVAGAFSADPDKSRQKGHALHLDPGRVYGSYEEMAAEEAALPEGEQIDFVSIVTPNALHFDIARTFIEEGFHVVCDKPMTTNLEDAEALCRLVDEEGVVFALTHNYSGYPMVKQARDRAKSGTLGTIRKVVVEYPQGWLAAPIEQEGDKQASWRTDPEQAGAGALGDIGSHAEHLARYVTGLRMSELFAEATSFVEGRRLEDDANLLVRYEGGAKGLLYCSQVSVGEENNLRLRVYGTDASLEWHQEHPNYLSVLRPDGPEEIHKRGNEYLSEAAQANGARIPPGHPEGFIEAFANVYRAAAADIAASLGGDPAPDTLDYPTVRDGAAGVHFIETALESSRQEAWLDARYDPPGA